MGTKRTKIICDIMGYEINFQTICFKPLKFWKTKGLYYIFAHNSYKDIQENIMLPQGEYSELIELLSHIVSDVATSYDREFTDVLDDLAKA